MSLNFDQYAQEGHLFVKKVAEALGTPDDIDHASRVTLAVFHGLRGRITAEESMHLVSQLPMALKAAYIDGWKISKKPTDSQTVHEFMNEIRSHAAFTAGHDLGDDVTAMDKVSAVIQVMKEYIAEGEWEDIRAELPTALAEFI